MHRNQALEILGLPDEAGPEEIMEVYKTRSYPLKRSLVTAGSVGSKNEHRIALRKLVLARDAALGRGKPKPDRLEMRWEPLVALLEEIEPDRLTHVERLALLDLPPGAGDADVQHHFTLRYRVLTRGLGTAHTEKVMGSLQAARAKMRVIRVQLLESDAPPVFDDTQTSSPNEAMMELTYHDAPESEDLDLTLTEGFQSASEERSAYDAAIAQIRGERSQEDDGSSEIDLTGVHIEPEPTLVTHPDPNSDVEEDGPAFDPRELLGLEKDAGADEITRAYRSRVRALRTRMLLTEDEDKQKDQLDGIRQLRRQRDAALRAAGVDAHLFDDEDELEQLPG